MDTCVISFILFYKTLNLQSTYHSIVKFMVYCSNCGAQIPDEANFCPKCGTKTIAGKAAKVSYPSDELSDVLYQVGVEIEKELSIAAHETQAAFKKVKDNSQEKSQSIYAFG